MKKKIVGLVLTIAIVFSFSLTAFAEFPCYQIPEIEVEPTSISIPIENE